MVGIYKSGSIGEPESHYSFILVPWFQFHWIGISFYTDVVKYLNGVKTSQNFNTNIFNSHLFSRNVLLVLN